MSKLFKNIVESIKAIDTSNSDTWNYNDVVESKIVEEQKVYFWIRLFLKEESQNIEIGDDITIHYLPTGEKLVTKFVCYGKEGMQKDNDGIVNWNSEDDKKVLCLMIDEKIINTSDEIPFIRTLFKNGRFYEYQLMKRDELQFYINRNSVILEYFDCDF